MARSAQTVEFLEECDCLYELLEPVPDGQWQRPTQFKGWTFNDVIGHLYMFDYAAKLTLEGPEVLRAFFAQIAAGRANGHSLVSYTRRWLGDSQGISLLQKWRAFYRELASAYADQDPVRRVAWGGPDMSVRSLISARQMETWAHGQAIFDVLGVTRRESDRLKNIAVMGVNTFGWTFANRKLPVPPFKPYVRLESPSGASWEWNSPEQADRITGSAVDFCRVITQTRNVADTRLEVAGPIAQQWMSTAQCFAGPPEEPPAAHTRYPQRALKETEDVGK
jgi:uncharacterized protein (TIGR03084 family)